MTLYLRRERIVGQEDYEVRAYFDPGCTETAGPMDETPRFGTKRGRPHGFCWKAIWLPDRH